MEWNAELYKQQHSYSVEYGKDMLSYVDRNPGKRILDVGCGTGALTSVLAEKGAYVLGIDASATMIGQAKTDFPKLEFMVLNATELMFENAFDTVFSNAAFHWIKDQSALLKGVYRALKPGGMLVCEFGAHGNIETIQHSFLRIMQARGYQAESQFCFPTTAQYHKLLGEAGLRVAYLADFDRPTPLKGGVNGLRQWLVQFYDDYLKGIDAFTKEHILRETEMACSLLWHNDTWIADYRRMRVVAEKKA